MVLRVRCTCAPEGGGPTRAFIVVSWAALYGCRQRDGLVAPRNVVLCANVRTRVVPDSAYRKILTPKRIDLPVDGVTVSVDVVTSISHIILQGSI